eukprot:351336-Chlamydomonas_euryale.AAC.2
MRGLPPYPPHRHHTSASSAPSCAAIRLASSTRHRQSWRASTASSKRASSSRLCACVVARRWCWRLDLVGVVGDVCGRETGGGEG